MILLIDNYDSFSYNLYQLIGSVRNDIKVIRNDDLSVEEIKMLNPEAIFLSPGPGHPSKAGVCIDVVKELGSKIPIFGVCLGHQAICEAYGGVVSYATKLMHGKTSVAYIDNKCKIFKGINPKINVARYHSLAVIKDTLPDCLNILAQTEEGDIMAVGHKEYDVYGVQFHPESILTPEGSKIIKNFLERIKND